MKSRWLTGLCLIVLVLSTTAQAGLDTRIYYAFDGYVDVGGTGDVTYGTDYFADLSGNAHHSVVNREGSGFASNAVTAPGRFGDAFRLERGTGQDTHTFSQTAHTPDLSFTGTDDFTFSLWSNANYAQTWRRGNYFGKANMDSWDLSGASQGYLFWRQSGDGSTGQRWRVNDTTGPQTVNIAGNAGAAWDDGTWALWTITHDGTTNTSNIYVNGALQGSQVHTTTNWANAEPFMIGSRHGQHQRAFTWPFGDQGTGLIDDFVALGDKLSDAEVLSVQRFAQHPDLGYAFGDVGQVLGVHRDGAGSVGIGGVTWSYATGLSGSLGEVTGSGTDFELRLTSGGTGMIGSAALTVTTITGTANGPNGSHDTWNNPANWDNGIPSGAINAIVANNTTAEAWNTATPAYTGSLTLGDNATLQMGWTTNYPESANALGGDSITMNSGSQIRLRLPFTVNLPEIEMAGDGSIHLSPSTSAHHTTRNFDGEITGPGTLTLIGNNNNTANLNIANLSWAGGFIADALDSWRVEANVSGAFGTGDVTFNARAANDRGATLVVDVADVIADTAALYLNGPRDHRLASKLVLNANDTVAGFWLDGVQMAPGDYSASSGLVDILGNPLISGGGTLTVLGSGPPPTGFVAYHDLGATTGFESTGNITTHQSGPSGTSTNPLDTTPKDLIRYSDGTDTGIDFSVSGANAMDSRNNGETNPPAPGTPADPLFNVAGLNLNNGTIYEGGNGGSGSTTFTLSGLDPDWLYDIALYGDRAASQDGVERFTLNGADAATNSSSTGIIGPFITDMQTRPNAAAGNIVRWTDVDPGADGIVTIDIDPEVSGGANLAYLSALRLGGAPSGGPPPPPPPTGPVAIYYDDFDGPGGSDLNGTAPDVRPGPETWAAHSNWDADGSKPSNGNNNSWLPFTPEPGRIYTLSLEVDPSVAASNDWFSLGFSNGNSLTNWHTSGDQVFAWMLNRRNDAAGDVIQTFPGPDTTGGAGHDLNPDVVGPVEMKVVLSTMGPRWTVNWLANGELIRGPLPFSSNPTINYVGFGAWNTATGTVDDFLLTGLEPEAILETDFTGRIVSGPTASSIPWIANGVADPGDLTVVPFGSGPMLNLFDTSAAQGHFAPDWNLHNEGSWLVTIPLDVLADDVNITNLLIDYQQFTNTGALQGPARDTDWIVSILDSDFNLIEQVELLDQTSVSGLLDMVFASPVALASNESYLLQILASGQGPGTNAGIDALALYGWTVPFIIPEPGTATLLGLSFLALARRRRRK